MSADGPGPAERAGEMGGALPAWRDHLEGVARDQSRGSVDLEVQIESEGGVRQCHRYALPRWGGGSSLQPLVRYGAALVNNHAMTQGGVSIGVFCGEPPLAEGIVKEVDRRFPQVVEVLSRFHERPVRPCVSVAPMDPGPRPPAAETAAPPPEPIGAFAGINVGQTTTKVSLMVDGAIVDGSEVGWPSWEGNPGHEPLALLERLRRGIAELPLDERRLSGIGLAYGGIVRAGRVVTRSGIALGMSPLQFDELQSIPRRLEAEYAVPVALMQDVVARTHYLMSRKGLRSTLVLDVGTSLGGVWVDASGAVPDQLNQVGRVAFDLSPYAVRREDGKASGVLSQYLSATGCRRVMEEVGLADTSPRSLADGLASRDPRAREAAARLGSVLAQAIRVLSWCYPVDHAVVGGGMMVGHLGRELLRVARGGLRSELPAEPRPTIASADAPLFGASRGCALSAARFRDRTKSM